MTDNSGTASADCRLALHALQPRAATDDISRGAEDIAEFLFGSKS
jgi:hypothetical protein